MISSIVTNLSLVAESISCVASINLIAIAPHFYFPDEEDTNEEMF